MSVIKLDWFRSWIDNIIYETVAEVIMRNGEYCRTVMMDTYKLKGKRWRYSQKKRR